MKKIKAYFSDLDAAVLSSRRVIFLEILVAFLSGVILGILIAPPRKLKMGCNNGNNNCATGNGCGNCKDGKCGDESECCEENASCEESESKKEDEE